MIKIEQKENCCGCNACSQICPRHCITMKTDHEGFWYPVVDIKTCIDCHLCEQACHELHPYDERQPIITMAAINTDEQIRMESSSGGIFTLLANATIEKGGVVFGARFNKEWQVEMAYTETNSGIAAFRGSKYVQAWMGTAYSDAKSFLQQGREVLFSGTPCQIAGLKRYLQKEYCNLLTVDVICHGVPSPKVWQRYLSEITSMSTAVINNCSFRDKEDGWKKFNFKMEYSDGSQLYHISSYHQENHYMRAFLNNITLRPSCYRCNTKSGRSHSDITIADFWGIQEVLPEMDDDKGTGLMLVNTSKGKEYIEQISMKRVVVNTEAALRGNSSWKESVAQPYERRMHFFKHLDKSRSVLKLIDKELAPRLTAKQRLKQTFVSSKLWLLNTYAHILGGGK